MKQSKRSCNRHTEDKLPEKPADTENSAESQQEHNWDGNPANPANWASSRKAAIITILMISNLICAIGSTAFEPSLPDLMADLHFRSESLASFTISIYTIGYCFGPLLVAPISEGYGRLWVLHGSYILYFISLIACGFAQNVAVFVIFRAIMGFAGIGFALLGPATVADLIPQERRGLALSMMSTGPVVGPTIGPIIGGYISENISWRWTFWSTTIALGVVYLTAIVVFKETYGPVVLRRVSNQDLDSGTAKPTIITDLRSAWTRPSRLLIRAPILVLLGSFTALTNSYAMICFATVGTIFQSSYGFRAGPSGLAYLGLTVGFVACQLSIGYFSDWFIKKMLARFGHKKPEYRLPPILIGSLILPAGFVRYGWSIQEHTHWIVPIVGTGFIAVGVLYTYLPVQLYVVDAFTIHAASASAVCTIIRSVCTTLVPLSANPLYAQLGYGWGNSLLAFIALAFVPFAILLIIYGEKIRTRQKYDAAEFR